ncbi:plasmid partitioning/stability family protein [Ferrimonas balearica]|uniref:plasmid partitioning/stability family protein n=1 Tax=Ferrimonas balearica TaxID=44012 RepID=UPI001C5A005F|nr:plasmid partitioning/stability family protein [Ferrimonas balearica]MBW3138033.1 plasmid partitioning/stability family protein [Ferrimonas balearica]MBW3164400.1 plasmid partitioning/stability family protein [Ferrimonas balearica]MBY6105110.1 plasmid partitioning/stability family protein [Ferrimonas balearica]
MRVSCSFSLTPEGSEADARAVQLLKTWQQAEQERAESPEVQRQRRGDFHRQIYLSGLFLHQLAPRLPALLAQALDGDAGAEQLVALAAGAGVELRPEPGLSAAQWQKLSTLMATAPTLDPSPIVEALLRQQGSGAEAPDNDALLGGLAALQAGQARTLAALTALSEQMAGMAPAAMPEAAPEPGLEAQLEKARKVKQKGLW